MPLTIEKESAYLETLASSPNLATPRFPWDWDGIWHLGNLNNCLVHYEGSIEESTLYYVCVFCTLRE